MTTEVTIPTPRQMRGWRTGPPPGLHKGVRRRCLVSASADTAPIVVDIGGEGCNDHLLAVVESASEVLDWIRIDEAHGNDPAESLPWARVEDCDGLGTGVWLTGWGADWRWIDIPREECLAPSDEECLAIQGRWLAMALTHVLGAPMDAEGTRLLGYPPHKLATLVEVNRRVSEINQAAARASKDAGRAVYQLFAERLLAACYAVAHHDPQPAGEMEAIVVDGSRRAALVVVQLPETLPPYDPTQEPS